MANALIHITSTPHVKPSLESDPTWMIHVNDLAILMGSARKRRFINTKTGQHLGAIAGVRKCQLVFKP